MTSLDFKQRERVVDKTKSIERRDTWADVWSREAHVDSQGCPRLSVISGDRRLREQVRHVGDDAGIKHPAKSVSQDVGVRRYCGKQEEAERRGRECASVRSEQQEWGEVELLRRDVRQESEAAAGAPKVGTVVRTSLLAERKLTSLLVPSDTSEASPTVSSQPEKSRGLSRLYLSGSTRKSQTRPSPPAFVGSTPGTGPTPASPPQRQQTATLPRPTSPESPRLRKRPMSSPTTALSAALPGINGAPQAAMSALSEDSRHRPPPSDVELKPGMTALDQIGPADHSGWMRKRGDRYNAWKLRYFALKGPHLYYVKTLSVRASSYTGKELHC